MKKIFILMLIAFLAVLFVPTKLSAEEANNNILLTENNTLDICTLKDHMSITCNNSAYIQMIKQSITMAILDLLTTGYDENSEPIYLSTCESQYGGCETHVQELVNYFYEQYELRGINPMVFAAITMHETKFDAFATNPRSGAAGIIQIMPHTSVGQEIDFIHDRRYRRTCKNVVGGCQREIVDAGAGIIERSLRRCNNNLGKALGMYGSGNCNGSRGFSRYVMRMSSQLEETQRAYMTHYLNETGYY